MRNFDPATRPELPGEINPITFNRIFELAIIMKVFMDFY